MPFAELLLIAESRAVDTLRRPHVDPTDHRIQFPKIHFHVSLQHDLGAVRRVHQPVAQISHFLQKGHPVTKGCK